MNFFPVKENSENRLKHTNRFFLIHQLLSEYMKISRVHIEFRQG